MATSLEQSEREIQIDRLPSTNKYLSFDAKIAKNYPVDPEIIVFQPIIKKRKKKEVNASKIYSPVRKFAERAKKLTEMIAKISFFA